MRELHEKLENKRKFSDWIKQRINHYVFIENENFIRFHKIVKSDKNGFGNKTTIKYYHWYGQRIVHGRKQWNRKTY